MNYFFFAHDTDTNVLVRVPNDDITARPEICGLLRTLNEYVGRDEFGQPRLYENLELTIDGRTMRAHRRAGGNYCISFLL